MIKLLGATALALTFSMPAAYAAHRHGHAVRVSYHRHGHGYRHLARHRSAWRHQAVYRYDAQNASFGESYAAADWRDREHYESRSVAFHSRGLGPRPRAWCGWFARQLVGQDPGPQFNLARNWAHWGHAASPGAGVMVVWPHHVGMITGRASNGEWIVKSGNDGHGAVHERVRSIRGAIAFRAG
ncbi:MAG TPA: hypothetical protein VGG01_07860 [Xanthobacteraceae bacterium]|jgi:hypothetical protein